MRLWIRADGSHARGLGHLIRTFALGQAAVERGWHVMHVVADVDGAPEVLRRRGAAVWVLPTQDQDGWIDACRPGDIVVFDGYHFGPDDFERLARSGTVVAAIDDLGHGEFPVHVLVNPSGGDRQGYDVGPHTRLLMGPRFALVRREFLHRAFVPEPGLLVLTFGGTDPSRATQAAIEALDQVRRPFPLVRVLLGPGVDPPVSTPNWVQLIADPKDVPSCLGSAAAAVSAAGSTTWELLTLGVPVALVQVADNQRQVIATVAEVGAGLVIGDRVQLPTALPEAVARLADPGTAMRLREAGWRLCDGRGAQRVLSALADVSRRRE